MAEVTISGANQWSDPVKIGIGRDYDVRVHTNTSFVGTVVVQRRRDYEGTSPTAGWNNVEGEAYTDVADRYGKVANINWEFRIGCSDFTSGSIVAGIWAD